MPTFVLTLTIQQLVVADDEEKALRKGESIAKITASRGGWKEVTITQVDD